jgi:hypothetical protein
VRGVLDEVGVLDAAGGRAGWLSLAGRGERVGVLTALGRILRATLTC